jgi:uncharacterized protein (TIGR03000 family)
MARHRLPLTLPALLAGGALLLATGPASAGPQFRAGDSQKAQRGKSSSSSSYGSYSPNSLSNYLTSPPSIRISVQTEQVAHLQVAVPAQAEVWINGQKSHRKGTLRKFVTPPLQPDRKYSYLLRVRWRENGHVKVRTRKVGIQAGRQTSVEFGKPAHTRIASGD